MNLNPKRLVIEYSQGREGLVVLTATRENLLILSQDLAAGVQEIPEESKRTNDVYFGNWRQHTVEGHEVYLCFQSTPDIEAYIAERKAARDRVQPWINGILAIIFLTFAAIGLWTAVRWIVF